DDVHDPAEPEASERPPGRKLHAIDQRSRPIDDVIHRSTAARRTSERLGPNPQTVVRVGAERADVALDRRQVVRHLGRLHRRWRRERWHALAAIGANWHAVDDDDLLTARADWLRWICRLLPHVLDHV